MNFEYFFNHLSMKLALTAKFEIIEKKKKIKANQLIFLKAGLVRSEMNEAIIKIYRPNSFINLPLLFCREQIDYFANTEIEIVSFDIETIKKEFQTNLFLFNFILECYHNEIKEANQRIYSLNTNNLKNRISRSLYYESKNNEIELHFNAADWANYVSSTRESVIRCFGDLRRDNIVDKKSRFEKPILINKNKLELY
jgi:CRP-like cAMP-binding protein